MTNLLGAGALALAGHLASCSLLQLTLAVWARLCVGLGLLRSVPTLARDYLVERTETRTVRVYRVADPDGRHASWLVQRGGLAPGELVALHPGRPDRELELAPGELRAAWRAADWSARVPVARRGYPAENAGGALWCTDLLVFAAKTGESAAPMPRAGARVRVWESDRPLVVSSRPGLLEKITGLAGVQARPRTVNLLTDDDRLAGQLAVTDGDLIYQTAQLLLSCLGLALAWVGRGWLRGKL